MRRFEVTLMQPGVVNPSTGKGVAYTLYDVGSGDNDYLLNATLNLEVNKAGTFEFDILPSHSYYSVLRRYIHYICVKEYDTGVYNSYDDVELPDDIIMDDPVGGEAVDVSYVDLRDTQIVFYGRILNMNLSFNGVKHVTCEGLMANLLDCPMYYPGTPDPDNIFKISGTPHNMFFMAIKAYRNRIRPDIYSGTTPDFATEYDLEDVDVSSGTSVGDFILSELVEANGGLLRMEYAEISDGRIIGTLHWDEDPDLNSEMSSYRTKTVDQTIEFGENLLDLSGEGSDDEIMTGIVPMWEDGNGDKHWVTQVGTDVDDPFNHGSIYMPYITGVQSGLGAVGISVVELPGTKSQEQAIKYARNYVNKYCSNYILSSGINIDFDSFTIRALDMRYLGKSSEDRIWLYDRVKIKSSPHSISRTLMCTQIELPIDAPENTSYTFSIFRPKASSNDKVLTRQIKRKRF